MWKKRYDPGHPLFPPPYGPSPHPSEGVREQEPTPGLLPVPCFDKEMRYCDKEWSLCCVVVSAVGDMRNLSI
jgi:hypothetical protein